MNKVAADRAEFGVEVVCTFKETSIFSVRQVHIDQLTMLLLIRLDWRAQIKSRQELSVLCQWDCNCVRL